MPLSASARQTLSQQIQSLYGGRHDAILGQLDELVGRYEFPAAPETDALWDETSVVLITYGDQVRRPEGSALGAQNDFLLQHQLQEVISDIHILPFFPYSSDDGFSVIDYRQVDHRIGDWTDVERLGESFGLMFDFVVNHCSQHNPWFQGYLKDEPRFREFFIDVTPDADLSAVTRPRTSPLLTPFETDNGTKYVWTTFSADQVDLNFASPDVLIEMLGVLLAYVQHGARTIRLDAIGFLWKEIGTNCMHLPQAHTVVKLMRTLLDDVAPGTILLTETNVPHAENISYFGKGDEAHAVYQFSLAPLLLDAFLTADAGPLKDWLTALDYPGAGMTYLNFTASHDGIGVRPLEGLVSQDRFDALIAGIAPRGGRVSSRTAADGGESPYELNITYFSALRTPQGMPTDVHVRRFLTSQGIMLSLRGIPAVYFHSLVGTANYAAGVEETGHNRTINRRKFDADELSRILADEHSPQRRVFDGYRHLLRVRVAQGAFHPDGEQRMLDAGNSALINFLRVSPAGDEQILVLANVGDQSIVVDVGQWRGIAVQRDLLSDRAVTDGRFELGAYDIAWLI